MSLVLLADDEAALLEVLGDVVSDLGHRVLFATDGEAALSMARESRPDLIITDHMMPKRSGVELLRALRAEEDLREIAVILVSAAEPRGAEEADLYLRKPVGLEQIEQAVADLLRARPGRQVQNEATLTACAESPFELAREEMLAWVAHEVKTPLAAAKMNAELLLRHMEKAGDQAERCNTVLYQLDRMNTLLTSMLEAAGLADGRVVLRRERRCLNSLLDTLLGHWREARPDFEFTLRPLACAEEVDVDPERFGRVLDQLISNAVKFSGKSKHVDVEARAEAGQVLVTVRDFGPGIDAAELPRFCTRFHRVEGSGGEGHGLGLYIASAVTRLHGGQLRVHSEKDAGTRFTVSLPMTHWAEVTRPAPTAAAPTRAQPPAHPSSPTPTPRDHPHSASRRPR